MVGSSDDYSSCLVAIKIQIGADGGDRNFFVFLSMDYQYLSFIHFCQAYNIDFPKLVKERTGDVQPSNIIFLGVFPRNSLHTIGDIVSCVTGSPQYQTSRLHYRSDITRKGTAKAVTTQENLFSVDIRLFFRPAINSFGFFEFIEISHLFEISVAFSHAVEIKPYARPSLFHTSARPQLMQAHHANMVDAKSMVKNYGRERARSIRCSDDAA